MVSVHERAPGITTFTFVAKRQQPNRGSVSEGGPVPQYIVDVHEQNGQLAFDWRGQGPNAPGTTQQEFEQEASVRLTERKEWIARVADLVQHVEQWAKQFGWTTRRIEKRLDDSRIGRHRVPALVMQQDTARVILEPVSRVVPGGKGLVELALMPAYDDVASLYFREGRWYAHYDFPQPSAIADADEAQEKPFSQEVFAEILDGMKSHVG